MPETYYPHGHHPTVLRSHTWRTAQNSCAYLLPHLQPHHSILDIGCGPGTLTCDLAALVPSGSAIGLDSSASVIESAGKLATERGVGNVTFRVGDVYSLPYRDGEFDVVHAHQVLQHLGNAAKAMQEMRRVTKAGGIVAVRDMSEFIHYPPVPELALFRDVFWKVAEASGTVPGMGNMMRRMAREGGFGKEDVKIGMGTWCFWEQEDLDWWCGMWADRVLLSDYHDNAIGTGAVTHEDLVRISAAWKTFKDMEDACYTVVNGEMMARKT